VGQKKDESQRHRLAQQPENAFAGLSLASATLQRGFADAYSDLAAPFANTDASATAQLRSIVHSLVAVPSATLAPLIAVCRATALSIQVRTAYSTLLDRRKSHVSLNVAGRAQFDRPKHPARVARKIQTVNSCCTYYFLISVECRCAVASEPDQRVKSIWVFNPFKIKR
jgi:hypothetical protein